MVKPTWKHTCIVVRPLNLHPSWALGAVAPGHKKAGLHRCRNVRLLRPRAWLAARSSRGVER
eukprot:8551162-Alexandrium_andersonii.AAC.1